MDHSLYNAASEGNVDVLRKHIDQLENQTTANSNTALHVAAQFGQLRCVAEILEVCPSLSRRENIKGETPLHMAAREGYADIVKELIECARKIEHELESGWGGATKEMLRATNVDGDTALHMAMRNCHLEKYEYLEVAKLLTREDPEFKHPANNANETPLYLAAERGYNGLAMVDALLETCTSPTYSGPAGRTALHAATLTDITGQGTKMLLEWKKDLIKEVDMNGWTPLHCAACSGNKEGVKELLKIDEPMLYKITTNFDSRETTLLIAAAHGNVSIMQEILSYHPDCWEMVNSKGQNVLHLAVNMEEEDVIKFILKKPWLRHLINQKDNEGNTPLHLLIASDCEVDELWMDDRADQQAFNNKNMTPIDLVWSTFEGTRMPTFAATYIVDDIFLDSGVTGGRNIVSNAYDNLTKLKRVCKLEKEKRSMKEKDLAKMRAEAEKQRNESATEDTLKLFQTYVIVAALIATISFAAAFTIPGGYDGNEGREQGMAVLARAAAFKGFIITNTIAMVSSVTSIFLSITATYYTGSRNEFDKHAAGRHAIGLILILVAMIAMMLAFITASFAVLAHSVALAVSTCIIGCIPFVVYFLEVKKISTHEKLRLRGVSQALTV